jgi:hypothetical protein
LLDQAVVGLTGRRRHVMNPYYVMMLFLLGIAIYAAILVIYDRKVRQPRMRELDRLIAEDNEKLLRESKLE